MSKRKRPKPTNNEILQLIRENFQRINELFGHINIVAQSVTDFIAFTKQEENFKDYVQKKYAQDDDTKTDNE